MPDLEERVAALEEAVLRLPRFLLPPVPELTPEQVAELRSDIEAALEAGPYEHRLLPSPPPLTPEQVRYLLRECVTVVKPGETLLVRVPLTWTPAEVDGYARDIGAETEAMGLPFKTVVVAADDLGVAEPEPGGTGGDDQP